MLQPSVLAAVQDRASSVRAASTTPLSDEADQVERYARFLRHARAGRMRGRTEPLTWEEAELCLFARADALRNLARRVPR